MQRLVVVATPNEVKLVNKVLSNQDYDAILITGVGGINIIQALKSYPQNTHIINVGFAGSAKIPKGSVVRVKQVSLFHEKCNYEEPIISLDYKGVKCYTSCDFVGNKDAENSVFDMELAFIAALGFYKVEGIKVISDSIDYEEYEKTIQTL